MSEKITVTDHPEVAAREMAEIRRQVHDHQRLERALIDWARADPPVVPILNLAQDEFSHDIVFPIGAELFLVYEST